MEKRWKLLEAPGREVKILQEKLGIHPALCKILVQRGILNFEEAKSFFRPSLSFFARPLFDEGYAKSR